MGILSLDPVLSVRPGSKCPNTRRDDKDTNCTNGSWFIWQCSEINFFMWLVKIWKLFFRRLPDEISNMAQLADQYIDAHDLSASQATNKCKSFHFSPTVDDNSYHPSCNGLVEWFNGILKQVLKRLCVEKPNDWDKCLSDVLFAYREVPQESLGFELVYGRSVREPVTILRSCGLRMSRILTLRLYISLSYFKR